MGKHPYFWKHPGSVYHKFADEFVTWLHGWAELVGPWQNLTGEHTRVPPQKCKKNTGLFIPGWHCLMFYCSMINVCYAGCMVSIGFESVNIRQGGHLTSTDPYILDNQHLASLKRSKIALKINGWKIELPFKGPGLWPIFRGEVFSFRDCSPHRILKHPPRWMRNASIVSMAIVLMTLFWVVFGKSVVTEFFGVFGLRWI